jgi:IclR family mhp operon transcriptional activator
MTVRAISRAIAVLSAVNRDGPITMMGIARAAQIPYPTASRIVHTLLDEGLIEREPSRKRYRVTSLVQTLSTGFQHEDALVSVSRPLIEELCRQIGWPVALATRVGPRMMLRDSTHNMTSLTFSNYYPGFTLPISECATGKVYLSHCEKEDLEMIIDGWTAIDNESSRSGLVMVGDDFMLNKIRHDGYAIQARNTHNAEPGKTSSLAVPIISEDGRLLAALGMVYFVSAMSIDEAAAEFVKPLKACAAKIAEAVQEQSVKAA